MYITNDMYKTKIISCGATNLYQESWITFWRLASHKERKLVEDCFFI